MNPPKVHNILLAADAKDAAVAIQRDPSLANASVITRESQLYGLWIGEWHITERAADAMRNLVRARLAGSKGSRRSPVTVVDLGEPGDPF